MRYNITTFKPGAHKGYAAITLQGTEEEARALFKALVPTKTKNRVCLIDENGKTLVTRSAT